jgi:hypothetical protein
MKPRHAAAWGALVGLLIPIAITVAVGVDDSLWAIWKLFIFLWPALYFVIGMAVAGPAFTPHATQWLVLVICVGTNVILYAILGWLARSALIWANDATHAFK